MARANALLPSKTSVIYDVYVYALDTGDGPAGTNEVESRAVVSRLDDVYNIETSGHYRFRFAKFTQLAATTAKNVCELANMRSHLGPLENEVKPRAGANLATWIVVTPLADCPYAGKATVGGQGIHMNGNWSATPPETIDELGNPASCRLDPLVVLAHEIGHNLGLGHAASILTNTTTSPLSEAVPWGDEYGDHGDIMGGNMNGLPSIRINSYNRDFLGVVPSDAIAAASVGTTTFTLNSIDSQSGTRLIYLPQSGVRQFSLEYRPESGRDTCLMATNGGQAGVYVRLDNLGRDASGFGLAETLKVLNSEFGYGFGSAVLPPAVPVNEWNWADIRQGLRAGETMNLPDGTQIQIEATNETAARVTITRPIDASPPTAVLSGPCPNSTYSCTLNSSSTPLVQPLSGVRDDVWLASATVSVDGVEQDRRAFPAPSLPYADAFLSADDSRLTYTLSKAGEHVITFAFTDISRNTTTITYNVSIAAAPTTPKSLNSTPSTARKLKVHSRSRTSVTLTWLAPKTHQESVIGYTLQSSRNGKTWKTVRGFDKLFTTNMKVIKFTHLRPGALYWWRVAATTGKTRGPWAVIRTTTKR